MSDSLDLIVTTKADLREIIRDAVSEAVHGYESVREERQTSGECAWARKRLPAATRTAAQVHSIGGRARQ